MAIDDLKALEQATKVKTQATIVKRASTSVQALETYVGILLREKYPTMPVAAWTKKEKAEAKDFLARYESGIMVMQLIECAITHWKMIRRGPGEKWLPPAPTFHYIYAARDHVAAYMATVNREYEGRLQKIAEQRRLTQEANAVRELHEGPAPKPKPEEKKPVNATPDEIKEARARGGFRAVAALLKEREDAADQRASGEGDSGSAGGGDQGS